MRNTPSVQGVIKLILGTSVACIASNPVMADSRGHEANDPKPVAPKGVISAAMPEYQWTPARGASQYEVEVRQLERPGNAPLFSRKVSAAAAGCASPSARDLCHFTFEQSLGNGHYKWRVRDRSDTGRHGHERNDRHDEDKNDDGNWSGFGNFKVDAATVSNQPPVASNSAVTLDEDTTASIGLSATDADNDPLTYTVLTQPGHGSLSAPDGSGHVTYTPVADFNGDDSFSFKVNDGSADSNTATVSITVTPVNDPPTANAGNDQEAEEGIGTVNLSGSGSDIDGDTLTYHWAQTDSSGVSVTLVNGDSENTSFSVPEVAGDTTLTFTLTVDDGHGGTATDTVNVLIKDNPVIQPTPTGRLNDTGIVNCTDNTSLIQNCPLATHPMQDAQQGRDFTHNDDTDGDAGFSFTKIDANGHALAIQDGTWNEAGSEAAGTKWSCVKDNVTGLIWEMKTNDGGLHDKDWYYSWYEPDMSKNGGDPGVVNSGSCGGLHECDTYHFAEKVNQVGLCGVHTWRVPTMEEMRSIVNYNNQAYDPAIAKDWFPNTWTTGTYGTSSTFSGNPNALQNITFLNGWESGSLKTYAGRIRLVSGN